MDRRLQLTAPRYERFGSEMTGIGLGRHASRWGDTPNTRLVTSPSNCSNSPGRPGLPTPPGEQRRSTTGNMSGPDGWSRCQSTNGCSHLHNSAIRFSAASASLYRAAWAPSSLGNPAI